MGFFSNTSAASSTSGLSPEAASVTAAVFTLSLSGQFVDLDRRIIGLFRDQFPRLSSLDEGTFQQLINEAIQRVQSNAYAANIQGFINSVIAPSIASAEDRGTLYRYLYVLAMADLNINPGEGQFLQAVRSSFGPDQTVFDTAEQQVNTEFESLFRALAAATMGLMVVSADGKAEPSELQDIRNSRTLLEPLGKLDDTQFNLVYDMGLNVHDRYLLDLDARRDFVENIIASLLNDREVRFQAFRYAASIATADGDIAQAELDTLHLLLGALGLKDETGDAVMEQFMSRVQTIDGKPRM